MYDLKFSNQTIGILISERKRINIRKLKIITKILIKNVINDTNDKKQKKVVKVKNMLDKKRCFMEFSIKRNFTRKQHSKLRLLDF